MMARSSPKGMDGDVQLSLREGQAKGDVRLGVVHLREDEGVALIDGSTLSFESEPRSSAQGAGSSRVSGVLEFGAVSLEGEGGRARIAPARLRFSGESGEGATIAGETELELSEVEVRPAEGQPLVVRGLELLEVRQQSAPDAHRDFRAETLLRGARARRRALRPGRAGGRDPQHRRAGLRGAAGGRGGRADCWRRRAGQDASLRWH